MGPDVRRADGNCHHEPTDDVIMLMTSRQRYNEDVSFTCGLFVLSLSVQKKRRGEGKGRKKVGGGRSTPWVRERGLLPG